ncbi:MAG: VanZ family protein, partial [Rhodothermales bacterium]|nr:VanZ family protein [Rhodothermales bacterium]
VYGMLLFRMTFPERSHLIEFGVVAMLIYEALSERRRSGRGVRFPALIAIGATTLIGVVDEVIQLFIPSRVFDPVDIAFNCFAAVLAVTSMAVLAFGKRTVMRRRSEDNAEIGLQ